MAVAAPAAASASKQEFVKQAHGFSLVQQQFVREYDSHVLMYKHDKTGAVQAAVHRWQYGFWYMWQYMGQYRWQYVLRYTWLCSGSA
jgi:hypothetical protein